jgi:HJR/Mrr/RecB family endonuclease
VDAGAFTFKKPTKPTAAEVERAQAMCDKQTTSVTALRLILAPAALEQSHASYLAAIDGEAKAAQRIMRAVKNKNWRDVELAMRTMDTARALEVKTTGDIEDYVAQFDPAASTTTTLKPAASTTTSTSTTAPAK